MDIPPPPPPPPSPDSTPPPGDQPAGPPPPPPPPPSFETGSPYGTASPYGGPPPYPQGPYGRQPPYGAPGPGMPPPYPGAAYGAPGPYGYPMPPQGWYAERPTNGLAIASLVTALTCLQPLGLIFGIISLRQIKRRGDGGRGLAIAGVVVATVGMLVTALVITLAVTGALREGNTRVEDLVAGDCFNTVHGSLPGDGVSGLRATTVNVVSCDEAHDGETFKVFPLDAGPDGDYPGAGEAAQTAGSRCADYAGEYLGDISLAESMEIYAFTPPAAGWDRGDHDVTCFFGSGSGRTTGSVTDGGDGTGFGV